MAPPPGGRRVVVLACGQPLRGDDAIAPVAVRGLPAAVLALADVRVVGGLEVEHLVDLPAGARVVLVDAVVGPPAGALVASSLSELAGRAGPVITTSSHQLPLDRVVALAQLLRDDPLEGRFVGIGVADVSEGEALSPPLRAALPAFREAIAAAVHGVVAAAA